jgi:hypothetical protein
MKLSDGAIERIREDTGADPVPDEHPVHEKLKEHFGDHTFYVDAGGLFVWEPAEAVDAAANEGTEAGAGDGDGDGTLRAIAFHVASWSNEEKTTLAPHTPRATNLMLTVPA